MSFPINSRVEHTAGGDFAGEVFVCDIDRTYLATRFSTLRGLAAIPFELAVDKQDIEGMAALLKEVRRGPNERSRHTPMFFVSASPVQLRPTIERKMLLDGIEHDGTTFKDWVRIIRQRTPARLREQLGFKLTALLAGRSALSSRAEEVLIGDDLETDPLAFALYGDFLSRAISEAKLMGVLRRHGVRADDARSICERRAGLMVDGVAVKRAFIRTERFSNPASFLGYAPFVVACSGALQMALGLL